VAKEVHQGSKKHPEAARSPFQGKIGQRKKEYQGQENSINSINSRFIHQGKLSLKVIKNILDFLFNHRYDIYNTFNFFI
jgi:hypothetical protein